MADPTRKGFRLARVLELRERQVEVARDRLQQREEELETVRAQRRELLGRGSELAVAATVAGEGAQSGAAFRFQERGRAWLEHRLQELDQRIEQCERNVAEARRALQAAEQERRKLDTLRERHAEAQRREARKQERKRMNRFGAGNGGGSQ
jgi:flagellar export protein FliJ